MFFYYKQEFTNEQVQSLLNDGFAVDGAKGGLILGRSHEEGGIYFLMNFGDCYKLMGEVEGYEYVINIASSYLMRNCFNEVNNSTRDRTHFFEEYFPDDSIRTIDTRLSPDLEYKAKFILFEGRGNQCIVNKFSTKKWLQFINENNCKYTYEYDDLGYRSTTKVHIIDAKSAKVIDVCPIIWK